MSGTAFSAEPMKSRVTDIFPIPHLIIYNESEIRPVDLQRAHLPG